MKILNGACNMSQPELIIGIGASAGGLEAFKSFISALPQHFEAAIIFFQHLSPDHENLLLKILQKQRPDIPITEVTNNESIQSGRIYINIPGKELLFHNHSFKIKDVDRKRSHYPIDHFFSSLAITYKEQAIGVVLSGTGTDGIRGCREIRATGGLVFVQDPITTEFDRMPQSVIDSLNFDQVLSPQAMVDEIKNIISIHTRTAPDEHFMTTEQYDRFCDIMQKRTGNSFNHYKRTVVARRLLHRLYLRSVHKLDDYFTLLTNSIDEAFLLSTDFMIGVSNFFRDPAEWDYLKEYVIEPLITPPSSDIIRIWTPGCATGEEAYTLAIIIQSLLDRLGIHRNWIIFATDINDTAIKQARQGQYPENVISDIPVTLHKYFIHYTKDTNSIVINKDIREKIIFGKQDLLNDPPFSNLDLIICRNVLSNFTIDAQEKCISKFYQSLKDNRFLFLGPEENIGKNKELFKLLLAQKTHIFQKYSTLTELHSAELALRESEKKYRWIFNNTQSAITFYRIIYDEHNTVKDLLIEDANQSAIDAVGGNSVEQYRNRLLSEILDSNNFTNHLKYIKEAITTNHHVVFEQYIKNSNCYYKSTVIPFEKDYIFTVCANITDIKLAQFKIEWEVKQRQLALDSAKMGWWKFNPETRIVNWDYRVREILSLNQDSSSIDTLIDTIIHSEDKNDVKNFLKKLLANNTRDSFSIQYRILWPNGDIRWLDSHGVGIFDEENKRERPSNFVGTVVDITEIKRAQENVQITATRFNRITSSNIIGMVIVTMKGQILYANDYFLKMLGYDHADLENEILNWRDLTPPEFQHLDDIAVNQLITTGVSQPYEKQYIQKNQERKWVYISGTMLPGTEQHVLAFIININNRKHLERQLEIRLGELALVNKELESFSYSVAHDLRNPLKNIKTFSDFLIEDHALHLDDEGKDFLKRIRNNAYRMNTIIDDIMALSKISQQEIEIAEVDLSEMAKTSLNELQASQPDRIVTISIQDQLKVNADPRLMSVALNNLLNNAWKYTSRTENAVIEFGSFYRENIQVFYIKDNGAGFEMKHAQNLFEPFQRLHSEKEFSGTGIGLAIVERAIKRHRGEIWAESAPDKGATFFFTLWKKE
jgi:two-component system CheB/CheR fusion protein